MPRPRILLISYSIPENKMGGGLLLHRHFVERQDFEIGIVTSNPATPPDVFYRFVPEPALLARMKRTRLSRWFHDYQNLIHPRIPDGRVLAAAREFGPDIIFNVAETYLSFHAMQTARTLNVPLASYFMDWANYATSSHGFAISLMDRRYRQLYQKSDLALCISEGMHDELGEHQNVAIVHPVPAPTTAIKPKVTPSNPFKFCFAGNLAHWYGTQIAEILNTIETQEILHLDVYGAHHNWAQKFETHHRNRNSFHGFKPFEELVSKFEETDAFLLPMGFTPESRLIERTSFKTKFLDYIQYAKPVLIWGPDYCTAARTARAHDSALVVSDADPKAAVAGMLRLATDASLRKRLVENANAMRDNHFNPHKIYSVLKSSIENTIEQCGANKLSGERHKAIKS